MELLVDTHVHIYPSYNLQRFFESALHNFSALDASGTAQKLLMLTERWDCAAFDALADGRLQVEGGFSIHKTAESDALLVQSPSGQELTLIAGRQVATAEKVEVLLLGARVDLPERLPLRDTIARGMAQGAVPVLNWSLGKWWFRRGEVIARAIADLSPQGVLLGDVLARPRGIPEPKQFVTGGGRGFRIVAGSDPLPIAGEERFVARYLTKLSGAFEPERPASSLRSLLLQPDVALQAVGARCDLLSAGRRLMQNEVARRREGKL